MGYGRILAALGATGLAVLILVGGWLSLIPPERLSIAAGRPGTAYHGLAEHYRAILAEDGIALEIRRSAGSAENAALLAEGAVDLAILQGGIAVPETGVAAEALGGLLPEAFLIFHRGALSAPTRPTDWRGLTVAAGAEGSGTRAAFEEIAAATGFDHDANTLLALSGTAAAESLRAGESDVAVLVAPLDAPYLAPLFAGDAIRLAAPADPEALTRRLDHLQIRTLPAGAIDYAARRPPRTVTLLTMPARLMARTDLHPAAVNRLVTAARRIHAGRGLLAREGEFPAVAALGAPIAAQARKLITQGPSPLSSVLPFWIVAQINRVALLLLPLLFVLWPLLRALPALYAWRMRARVFRRYRALREIDIAVADASAPLDELEARLDRLEEDIRRTPLPPAHRGHAYVARQHIALIRETIARKRAGEDGPGNVPLSRGAPSPMSR